MTEAKRPGVVDRRRFLRAAAAATGGAIAAASPLRGLVARAARTAAGLPEQRADPGGGGYGELAPIPDLRDGVARLALPPGFRYRGFSFEGDPWDDAGTVPKAHDGMAAFALPNGNIRLIRNHEDKDVGAVKGDPAKAYDPKGSGGASSLEVRVHPNGDLELVRHFMSLNGTSTNCAGGPTPWGSWLSCEETTLGKAEGFSEGHGYIFEVPVIAEDEVDATPFRAMGRFEHEAAAVDPRTGIVYETEDQRYEPGDSGQPGSGFYRFLPNRPGDLAAGGTLQVLGIEGVPGYDTTRNQQVNRPLLVEWLDIEDPDPPSAETDGSAVFREGLARGAAIFQRLEGCWFGHGSVFFTATKGGDAGVGQIWQFIPALPPAPEGGKGPGGTLQLLFESPSAEALDSPDNITVTPRRGLLVCEDGGGEQFLRGLTLDGGIFDFAINLVNTREWAGVTFSPDGHTLFVNIQGDNRGPGGADKGMTFAVWGPWERGVL